MVRGYFGQFDIIQGAGLAEQVNPNGLSTQIYKWTDTNGDGIPENEEWNLPASLIAASGGVVTSIDGNLKRPYTNEVNVGYEQQIWSSLSIRCQLLLPQREESVRRIESCQPGIGLLRHHGR